MRLDEFYSKISHFHGKDAFYPDPNHLVMEPGNYGCAERDGEFIVFEVDERGAPDIILQTPDRGEALDKLFQIAEAEEPLVIHRASYARQVRKAALQRLEEAAKTGGKARGAAFRPAFAAKGKARPAMAGKRAPLRGTAAIAKWTAPAAEVIELKVGNRLVRTRDPSKLAALVKKKEMVQENGSVMVHCNPRGIRSLRQGSAGKGLRFRSPIDPARRGR